MTRTIRAWFVILSLMLTGPAQVTSAPAGPGESSPSALVKNNNRFALDLYAKLRVHEGNLFFSPFSVSTTLAMTSAGARGKTLEQMNRAAHLPEQKKLHPALGELIRQLRNDGGQAGQLSLGAAVWEQKGRGIPPAVADQLQTAYGAGPQQVDFRQPEEARRAINAWAAKVTHDRIKELIHPGGLDREARLVAASAIHFKGEWQTPFKKDNTREAPFTPSPGKRVGVPFLHQLGSFPYHADQTAQVLELPYAGKRLSMVVLLPRTRDGLADMEKGLTPARLGGWLAALQPASVQVALPRFQLASEFELRPVLSDLGMPLAFSQSADFSGFDGSRSLYLSAVIHKAQVQVNEQGSEAAAVTASLLRSKSGVGSATAFQADHPFLFLIRDRRSDAILFLGRCTNPLR